MSREYCVQHNNGKFSCGPIALLNALRHQGHKAQRRHLPWLARKLKSKGDGVYADDLDRVGRQMGALKRIYRPSVDKINAELVKGNAVALRLGMKKQTEQGKESFGHFLLLTAIWCHCGNISYYVCNIGRRCKWMEFGDIDEYYRGFYDDWWVTHFWAVPLKRKKLRLA